MSIDAPVGQVRNLLLRSVLSNHAGVIGSICIAFVMSPIMVNQLGDARYGIWSILSALGGYLVILDFGIGSAIIRFVSRDAKRGDHARMNEVLGSAFFVYLVLSTLLLLCAPLVAAALARYVKVDEQLTDVLWLLGIVTTVNVAISMSAGLLRGTLLGHQRYDVVNGVQLIMSVIASIIMYWLLTHDYGLVALSLVGTATNIVAMGVGVIFIRANYPYIRFDPTLARRDTARQVANFGKFSFMSMLAGQFVFYSDALVIGILLSASAVTYYSIAVMFIEYANKLIRGISTAYMPHFSALESSDEDADLAASFLAGSRFVLLLSNLLCTGILVMAGPFIGIWMGEQYVETCAPIVMVLLVMQYVRGPQLLGYALLHGVGQHQRHSYWNMFFAVANIVLSVLLIPRFGIMGVAIATVATQVVFHGVVSASLSCAYLGIAVLDYYRLCFLRALPSTLALALVLYLLTLWHPPDGYRVLLLESIAGGAVYLVVSWLTLLDRPERARIVDRLSGTLRRLYRRLAS